MCCSTAARTVYDPSFTNGDSFDTTANPGGKDGLNFNANVGVGALQRRDSLAIGTPSNFVYARNARSPGW